MYKALSKTVFITSLVTGVSMASVAGSGDPLRPPGYQAAGKTKTTEDKPESWLVNEILHSEGRRLAIVNNKTVKQGDLVDGARVMEITAEQVTLKYEDRIINSRLGLVPVKKLKTNNTGR